jgi:hypothetical protein
VTVRAIAQLWGRRPDKGLSHELTIDDFDLLTSESSPYDEAGYGPEIVYSDFVVEEVSEHESYLHGESWHIVRVKSTLTDEEYELWLDTWLLLTP